MEEGSCMQCLIQEFFCAGFFPLSEDLIKKSLTLWIFKKTMI